MALFEQVFLDRLKVDRFYFQAGRQISADIAVPSVNGVKRRQDITGIRQGDRGSDRFRIA
jgi:hypothetical protein